MKKLMIIWVYLLPFPVCIAAFLYWREVTKSQLFALFIIALPVLYGYIIPGIGTNIMKKWRFHGKMLLGNYYIHHGFKYASNLNLSFFVAFSDAYVQPNPSLHRYITIALSTAFIQGYIIWIHDTHCIKQGMLELDNPFSRAGKSAEEISFQYAPLTFFLIGLTFAISSLIAYQQLVVENNDSWRVFSYCLLGGFTMMACIPSIVFGFVEKSWDKLESN
ncbi:MAG: hypothetical protein GY808_14340 [Gammaproteobacteria bacterium]|nr:hypothetical protein [Gammaproteobacteria bacterium]